MLFRSGPYGCALMMVSYILSKYLPRFIKDINIDVNETEESEGMAK